MDFKTYALKYAAAGLYVLPIVAGGKMPAISKKAGGKGVWDATTDEDTILAWATDYPDCNIAIHPGPSDLVVLDFDTKSDSGVRGERPNGLDTLADLKEKVPEIASAWIVATPTGGFHYFFTPPPGFDIGNPVRIALGLDIRHKGTYVLAAPSVHPEGGIYKWVQKQGKRPPILPQAIVDMLTVQKTKVSVAKTEWAQGQEIHERHAVLIRQGAMLRNTGLDKDSIKAALMVMNEKYCRPGPLSEREIDRIVRANGALIPARSALQEAAQQAKRRLGHQSTRQVYLTPSTGKKLPKFRLASEITPSEVQWLMPGFFALGRYNLLWGMEGRSKTYASIGMAALVTRGAPFPGEMQLEAKKPGSVVFLNFEDDPSDTTIPRLIKCGADLTKIHIMHYDDGFISSKDAAGLGEVLKDIPDLRLVVIDPITSFAAGISDIDETAVRSVVDPLNHLAMGKEYAIIGVKHPNKRSDVSASDKVSGSRAWTGAARCVVLAGHDNERENDENHTYGAIMQTKANLVGVWPARPYVIDHGIFRFAANPDPTITPDRLFPKKPPKESKNG